MQFLEYHILKSLTMIYSFDPHLFLDLICSQEFIT